MKKFAIILAAAFSLTACSSGGGTSTPAAASQAVSQAADAASAAASQAAEAVSQVAAAAADLASVGVEQPVLLTSAGQSADVQIVKTLLSNAGVDLTDNNLATGADLGSAKTLVVAIGGSSKGLGAAGIDANQELARVEELLSAAKSAGVKIVAMHTGGSARRGELSDKFITPVFEQADCAIIVGEGDSDGLMAGLAESNGIPMETVDALTDIAGALGTLFQ